MSPKPLHKDLEQQANITTLSEGKQAAMQQESHGHTANDTDAEHDGGLSTKAHNLIGNVKWKKSSATVPIPATKTKS